MTDAIDMLMRESGLECRPFPAAPESDPAAMHWSHGAAAARAVLDYGLAARAPLLLLTGDDGCGKTTMVHQIAAAAPDARLAVGIVGGLRGRAGELMDFVLSAFDVPPPEGGGHVARADAFVAFLIERYAAGERTLLVVDEAHLLTDEEIETLRALTNVNTARDELVQVMLVGGTALRARLAAPALAHVAQRVGATAHLGAMDAAGCVGFLRARLARAGAPDDLFTDQALLAVAAASRGVPRVAGQLAELALVIGPAPGEDRIGARTVQQVVEDGLLMLPPPPAPSGGARIRLVA